MRSATLARDFVIAWSWPRINAKIKQRRLQIFHRNHQLANQTKRAVKFVRGAIRVSAHFTGASVAIRARVELAFRVAEPVVARGQRRASYQSADFVSF